MGELNYFWRVNCSTLRPMPGTAPHPHTRAPSPLTLAVVRAGEDLASQQLYRERVIALIAELLLESPYLLRLRSDELKALSEHARAVRLGGGETLAARGRDYLVLDGLLAVKTIDDDSGARGVGLFGPGEQVIANPSSQLKAMSEALLLELPDQETADGTGACIVYEYDDDDEALLV